MNESFKTDPSLATSARAANESGSYLCASNVTPTAVRFIVSVFLCLLCSCRMSSTQMTCSHFRKNRPKKRQKPAGCRSRIISKKPAGSDLWPVNRCIPSSYQHLSVCTVADLTNRRGKQPLRVPGNHGPHLIFAKHTWCYGEGQMFTHHSKWRVFVRCGVLQACESSHYNTM